MNHQYSLGFEIVFLAFQNQDPWKQSLDIGILLKTGGGWEIFHIKITCHQGTAIYKNSEAELHTYWNEISKHPIPNAGEAAGHQELSFIAVGKAKWSNHFEDSLAIS